MGLEDIAASSLTGLSFSGLTVLTVGILAGVVWCLVPFVLLAMHRRMAVLEQVMRENLTILANDMRRVTDILLMERIVRDRDAATPSLDPALQPHAEPPPFNLVEPEEIAATMPAAFPSGLKVVPQGIGVVPPAPRAHVA